MMGQGFGVGLPGLGMLIFWGVIIFLLVVLFRGVSSDRDSASGTGARDTLDRRYARGEIDKNEYEQIKQSLK
jgi:putative membrane protein